MFIHNYTRSFTRDHSWILANVYRTWHRLYCAITYNHRCKSVRPSLVQHCSVHLHLQSSPKCPIYYPNDYETTMKIGSTTLLKLIEKEFLQETMIIRQFSLTDTREALSKTIFHFEYLPPIATDDEYENEHCQPTGLTHSLFDFIGQINKRRPENAHHRFITVHCG